MKSQITNQQSDEFDLKQVTLIHIHLLNIETFKIILILMYN